MSELEDARNGKFAWGRVIDVHEIGPYSIVEYQAKIPDKYTAEYKPVSNRGYKTSHSFHAYVNGRDTSHSWDSLDEALVFAISYRTVGPNAHVSEMFMASLEGMNRRGYKGWG